MKLKKQILLNLAAEMDLRSSKHADGEIVVTRSERRRRKAKDHGITLRWCADLAMQACAPTGLHLQDVLRGSCRLLFVLSFNANASSTVESTPDSSSTFQMYSCECVFRSSVGAYNTLFVLHCFVHCRMQRIHRWQELHKVLQPEPGGSSCEWDASVTTFGGCCVTLEPETYVITLPTERTGNADPNALCVAGFHQLKRGLVGALETILRLVHTRMAVCTIF